MSIMTWNESWKTGIGALDNEHRDCFQLLDDIHTAVKENDAGVHDGRLLRMLYDRVRAHFAAEEAMMVGDRYPGVAIHAMKHEHLAKQLLALIARVERAPTNLNEHALKFLLDWFQTHLVQEDRAFGVWLNEHGKY